MDPVGVTAPPPCDPSMSFTAMIVAANTNSGTRNLIRFGLVRVMFALGLVWFESFGLNPERGPPLGGPLPVSSLRSGRDVLALDARVKSRVRRRQVWECGQERFVVLVHAVTQRGRVGAVCGLARVLQRTESRLAGIGEGTRDDTQIDVGDVVGQTASVRVARQVTRERAEALRAALRWDGE